MTSTYTDSKDQLQARASELDDNNNVEDDISTGLANMTIDNLDRTVKSTTSAASLLSKFSTRTARGSNVVKKTKGKSLIRLPHRVHVWRDNSLRIRVSVIIKMLSGTNAVKTSFGLDNKSNPKSSIFKMMIPYDEMFTNEYFSIYNPLFNDMEEEMEELANDEDFIASVRMILEHHPRVIRFTHDVTTFNPDPEQEYVEEFHIDLGIKCCAEYVTKMEDPWFHGIRVDQGSDGAKYLKVEFKGAVKEGEFIMSPGAASVDIRTPIIEEPPAWHTKPSTPGKPPGEISITKDVTPMSITKTSTQLRTNYDKDHDTTDQWAKNTPDAQDQAGDGDDSSTIASALLSFSVKHKSKKPRIGSSYSLNGARQPPNRPSPTNHSTSAMSRLASKNKRSPYDAFSMLKKVHQQQN